MQLGLFLKEYRKAVSLSGHSLAQRIGVSKHCLEKWENAGTMPNYASASKLMKYFGLENLEDIEEKDCMACIARSLQKPAAGSGLPAEPRRGADDFFPFYFTNLLSEKEKRIKELEQMIKILREQNRALKKGG